MASKTFGRLLLRIFVVLAFCVVSAYALFFAYGYNLDLQHRNIEKTSIIDIPSHYSEVRVYVDDKLTGNSLPLQLKDLLPGFYRLAVNKLGFLPWSRNLEVRTDLVTKVDDLVLVPENTDSLQKQLARFPDDSRYFFGEDAVIVVSPQKNYLTVVHLLGQGTMQEEELQLHLSKDIKDIHVYSRQKFLMSFEDESYELVDLNGPRYVDFTLPDSAYAFTVLPDQNLAYFLSGKDLYRVAVDLLPSLSTKKLADFLLLKNVDQFDVHNGKLLYLSKGLAYSADDQGKKVRLIDRSRKIVYIRFQPFKNGNGGLYLLRTKDGKRALYAVDSQGFATLLSLQLKGEPQGDIFGNTVFGDESGNIFHYKPLLKKKILIANLPGVFALLGQIFNDGHFLVVHNDQLVLADSTYSNVYSLFNYDKESHLIFTDDAIFTLNLSDQKLKSLFFLPR